MITILNETTRKEIDQRNKQMWNDIRQSLKDHGDSDWNNAIGYMNRLPKEKSDEFYRYSRETACIDMLHSILTYSDPETWTVDNILKDHYMQQYIKELGKDTVANLIQQEIAEYQDATIDYNSYTDSEGLSYNSVRFRDDKSYKRESVHTDLVDQFFADVQDVVDYFRYHNKNLNKTQDYLLYDLEDALDSRSTLAAREAIANLKNHSKGMNNTQSSMIEELYGELFASGEYKDIGRPSYDESYKRESVDGKQTLADWISNPRNQRRYGNDEIMVVCMNPYLDDPDDCPGVLFDGTFDELKNGTGDNYISDSYDIWVVTGTTYKRYGGTDFLEISVDSIH